MPPSINSGRQEPILLQRFQSIAFPLIGIGSGGFDRGRAKTIMLDELNRLDYPLEMRVVVLRK
jgi:O-acetyl-ADP-ribose deacetylase